MGSPVTTNPITIMFINMTVVFAVLYGLSLIIRLIKMADPTQKKKLADQAQPMLSVVEQAAAAEYRDDEEETCVIIAAAVAALGYNVVGIAAVRPEVSRTWRQAGRFEALAKRLHAAKR